jgi:hypoxanthine phosphoribosyltransferase
MAANDGPGAAGRGPVRPDGSGGDRAGEIAFAHPVEAEFARLLDFYRIAWRYEPTAFPLARQGDRVTEAFRPDFYLPERDLYVELTTVRQRLIDRKRRKLRRFRELYPAIDVVLLSRADFSELLGRFGYGAVEISALPEGDIERILYSPGEIAARVAALGAQISADYAGRSLLLVGLLKGVTFFMADLARAVTRPLAVDFLAVARPGFDGGAEGAARIVRDLDVDVRGQHVLLIEDIANTGLTLDFVRRELLSRRPASLEICLLFDKRERRLVDVPVRYAGFAIPNAWVVGYGLDYRELYRNLPFLCVLKPRVYEGALGNEVPAGDPGGPTAGGTPSAGG